MNYKAFGTIVFVLISLGWIVWNKIQEITEELRTEKETTEKLAAMTPGEIEKREGVKIKERIKISHWIGFFLSIISFILLPLFTLIIVEKEGLADSIIEKASIFISIAIPFILWIKFGSKVFQSMYVKELKEIGEKIKTENYYLLTFKRALKVLVITVIFTLLFWYFIAKFL